MSRVVICGRGPLFYICLTILKYVGILSEGTTNNLEGSESLI
jgi:hypothetical protein